MKVYLADLKLALSLIFFSLVLILFDSLGLLNLPKSLVQTLTVPVQFGLYKSLTTFSQKFTFIFSARQAFLESKALKKQLGELLVENSNLRSKLKDNEALVDQYNKLNPKTYDLLPARVISSGRNLTIDKGSEDGLTSGEAVVFEDSLIGQIKNVNPKTSTVLLPFDPDSKIAVYSQGDSSRARGILEGQFGSELLMDKIIHQETVSEGDLVYSEGTEGRLPKGLVVGQVKEVFERQNEVFKQAKVSPIFDLKDLDVVFVIRSP